MATSLDVVNQALLLLGEGLITQGQLDTPDDDTSRSASLMLRLSIPSVIRDIKPNFARAYEELALAPDPGPFSPDFMSLYELPDDCLRVIRVMLGDPMSALSGRGLPVLTRWRVLGRFLGADETPVFVEYIKEVTDTDLWDPLSSDALAAFMAWKLALPLTESTTKFTQMSGLYEELKRQAETADDREGFRDQIRESGTLSISRHGAL